MPSLDEEIIVLKPTAPLTDVYYSKEGFTGGDRCVATEPLRLLIQVRMPSDFIFLGISDGNHSATFLNADNRTLHQNQVFSRCTAGGYATSGWMFSDLDIYGDGRGGAHGGSGLSGFGGDIRLGELRPGQVGMNHVLKVNVYVKEALFNCDDQDGNATPGNPDDDCFRWPAYWGDGYSVGWYGTASNDPEGFGVFPDNFNTAMRMGSLLAIPATGPYTINIDSLGLETVPARQLAWTLQNYGAYIVDDAYGPAFYLNTENGADGSKQDEFWNDWSLQLDPGSGWRNTPWQRDMQRLVAALYVVNNNSPTNIGGGGAPLQPLAPAFGSGGSTPTPTPILTATPTPTPIPSGNLLSNPGFETGSTSPWSGWQADASLSSIARSGGYGGKAAFTTGTYGNVYTIGQDPVSTNATAGQTYYATAWVRGEGSSIGKTSQVTIRERGSTQ
ncbi:MAG: hypothetical protein Q8O55_05035, partial [Dehalococcoidales bacterium]|nr:hypothetical protein [Dehalococcoidales bacterium]